MLTRRKFVKQMAGERQLAVSRPPRTGACVSVGDLKSPLTKAQSAHRLTRCQYNT